MNLAKSTKNVNTFAWVIRKVFCDWQPECRCILVWDRYESIRSKRSPGRIRDSLVNIAVIGVGVKLIPGFAMSIDAGLREQSAFAIVLNVI